MILTEKSPILTRKSHIEDNFTAMEGFLIRAKRHYEEGKELEIGKDFSYMNDCMQEILKTLLDKNGR